MNASAEVIVKDAAILPLFLFSWLILFPVGCVLALLSFPVAETMSGRFQTISVDEQWLALALIDFSIVALASYAYFACRPRSAGRTRPSFGSSDRFDSNE